MPKKYWQFYRNDVYEEQRGIFTVNDSWDIGISVADCDDDETLERSQWQALEEEYGERIFGICAHCGEGDEWTTYVDIDIEQEYFEDEDGNPLEKPEYEIVSYPFGEWRLKNDD